MSVRKVGKKWKAEVRVKGEKGRYKTFDTKAKALLWVEQTKDAIKRYDGQAAALGLTVKDMLERYKDTKTRSKKGQHWETLRIKNIMKSKLAGVELAKINGSDIAMWRDRRLTEVSNSTVNRELNIITHAFSIAVDEWCWLPSNPTKRIRRPVNPPPRDRRISSYEIESLCNAMEYSEDCDFKKKSQRLAAAFLFAIETAMRLGEICKLEWSDIFDNVARARETKNGHPRDVPLSKRAIDIINKLPRKKKTIFDLTSEQGSAIFRRCREKTDIKNIVFHDTRHEAITRLAEKLKVLDLARMTGHKDINMLNIYYNEKPSSIANKLD